MAWIDQCHIAFRNNAEGLIRRSGGKQKLTVVLKKMAEQSGIPWQTLYRWWQESVPKNGNADKVLKNENNNEAVETTNKTRNSNDVDDVEKRNRPICQKCKRRVVMITRVGKPLSENAKNYGLCSYCVNKQRVIEKLSKAESEHGNATGSCPKCHYAAHISVFYITDLKNEGATARPRTSE